MPMHAHFSSILDYSKAECSWTTGQKCMLCYILIRLIFQTYQIGKWFICFWTNAHSKFSYFIDYRILDIFICHISWRLNLKVRLINLSNILKGVSNPVSFVVWTLFQSTDLGSKHFQLPSFILLKTKININVSMDCICICIVYINCTTYWAYRSLCHYWMPGIVWTEITSTFENLLKSKRPLFKNDPFRPHCQSEASIYVLL